MKYLLRDIAIHRTESLGERSVNVAAISGCFQCYKLLFAHLFYGLEGVGQIISDDHCVKAYLIARALGFNSFPLIIVYSLRGSGDLGPTVNVSDFVIYYCRNLPYNVLNHSVLDVNLFDNCKFYDLAEIIKIRRAM